MRIVPLVLWCLTVAAPPCFGIIALGDGNTVYRLNGGGWPTWDWTVDGVNQLGQSSSIDAQSDWYRVDGVDSREQWCSAAAIRSLCRTPTPRSTRATT
jgi:hypothetical protein